MSSAAPDSWRRRRSQAERLADAESARIDADTARREAQLERDRAERERHRAEALRVAAESTAYKALQERDEALAKAAELEATLTQVAEATPAEPAPAPDPTPVAAAPAPPSHDSRVLPEGPDVSFAAPVKGATVTVLLSVAALCAAGTAVYLAYLDRLASLPGVVTAVVTVVLAVSINRAGHNTSSIAIRRGIVVIDGRDSSARFDLTSPATLVEMIGQPGDPDWKVVFLRKTRPPVSVDGSMVDPHRFADALHHWRPNL